MLLPCGQELGRADVTPPSTPPGVPAGAGRRGLLQLPAGREPAPVHRHSVPHHQCEGALRAVLEGGVWTVVPEGPSLDEVITRRMDRTRAILSLHDKGHLVFSEWPSDSQGGHTMAC